MQAGPGGISENYGKKYPPPLLYTFFTVSVFFQNLPLFFSVLFTSFAVQIQIILPDPTFGTKNCREKVCGNQNQKIPFLHCPKTLSEYLYKNKSGTDWSAYNGKCLIFMYILYNVHMCTQTYTRLHPHLSRDRLGFYAEIQIIFDLVL